jgi:hypothetical protein
VVHVDAEKIGHSFTLIKSTRASRCQGAPILCRSEILTVPNFEPCGGADGGSNDEVWASLIFEEKGKQPFLAGVNRKVWKLLLGCLPPTLRCKSKDVLAGTATTLGIV